MHRKQQNMVYRLRVIVVEINAELKMRMWTGRK